MLLYRPGVVELSQLEPGGDALRRRPSPCGDCTCALTASAPYIRGSVRCPLLADRGPLCPVERQSCPRALTTATIDRPLRHARTVVTQGDSFQLNQATSGQRVISLGSPPTNSGEVCDRGREGSTGRLREERVAVALGAGRGRRASHAATQHGPARGIAPGPRCVRRRSDVGGAADARSPLRSRLW
jgi:hypothetical protein